MSVEQIVQQALAHLAGGQLFVDVAPQGTRAPWITYQTIAGTYLVGLDGVLCRACRARVQVSVWSRTRAECTDLMQRVVVSLVNATVKAVPLGGPANVDEPNTQLRGSRMDFSITFDIGEIDGGKQ